jgi:hypothetical protein
VSVTSEEAYQRSLGKATAMCRHCERWIVRLDSGIWIDADGFGVCVKACLGSIMSSTGADFVVHAPMPDGLRGAPS